MKLNGLVTNIRALGEEVLESYVVKKLLRAVPTKFLQIASMIDQFGNIEQMSVEETVGSLKIHEERLKGSKNGGGGVECNKPKRNKVQRAEVNMAQFDDDEPALLLTEHDDKDVNMMLLKEEKVTPKLKLHGSEKSSDSDIWYLDNGASNHMTGQRSKFKMLDECVKGQVKFGDGSMVEIKGKGTVSLKCKTGEERELHEVFFIPSLCNNIISLGQLSEAGNKVVLNGEYLWIHEKQGKLLMKVKRSANRLYKIIIESGEPKCLLLRSNENAGCGTFG
ncbi:uncharacterized protein LOC141701346 [Apium graveolens]|uniref:uncharacterized protein LOC141701346 n=1 Tax=Apium graveolens TaxID=4045 RepID=UPI003D7B7CEE